MENNQLVATKGSPPVAFAARNENDWAQLVREPIESCLTALSVRQFRFLARGLASTSAHQSSPVAVSSSTKFGMRQRSAAHTLAP